MASQPSLRIGDTERDAAAAELREHYAHGRLTLDEFSQRLDAVFAAKTRQDLSRITGDLPHVRPGDVPLPSERVGREPSRVSARPYSPIGRPGSRPGGGDWLRGGFTVLAVLVAAALGWLLVYGVFLNGLGWPAAGRLGLFIAVFAVLRSILRRIFGWPGRRGPGCRRRW